MTIEPSAEPALSIGAGRSTPIGTATYRPPRLVINGRFLGQRLSGVQRFAREIVSSLDALLASDPDFRRGSVELHHPRECTVPNDLEVIRPREVGRRSGHGWEQIDLALSARGAALLSLGNTGPALHGRQMVVIHDASVLAYPDNFTFAFRNAYRGLFRILARSAERVMTVSHFSAGELGRYLRLSSSTIPVIYNGGDHFARISADPSIVRRHGLADGDFILAIASASRTKNTPLIEGALERMGSPRPRLVWVGARESRIFQASDAPQAPDAVWLELLSDADLKALYERALCLVFPSIYEGFGLPPLEAMECGCPVLASDIGAVREVCDDAVLYFDPRDDEALARQIERVRDGASLRRQLREMGRARAAAFTWAQSGSRMLKIVREVAAI